jgi:hypothetical protein
MTNDPQIAKPDSTVKTTLDRLELVEKVPALTRASGRALPRHPAVIAYVNECAAVKRPDVGLRVARRNFKLASVNFENRCAFRAQPAIEWCDDGKFCSLSAIIEARADALHWRKVIMRLEAAAKIKQQARENARQIERARPEWITIGGELYPVSK